MGELPEKAYYRIEELALYWDVTERTIRLWITHGKLKAIRVGAMWRIPRESIQEFPIRNNTTSGV